MTGPWSDDSSRPQATGIRSAKRRTPCADVDATEPLPAADAAIATVTWAGETLALLPERAVLWPARRWLLVADVHLGKDASFRSRGVPLPAGAGDRDLDRLTRLVLDREVAHLVILGDLLHDAESRSAATLESIGRWRARHDRLEITLVRGNHDRRAGDPPPDLGIRCVDEPAWSLPDGNGGPDRSSLPFGLVHDPTAAGRSTPGKRPSHESAPAPATSAADATDHPATGTSLDRAGRPVLAGHVHPVVRPRSRCGTSLRCPAFIFGPSVGLLPSFGSMTGGHPVRPRPGDRVFAVGPDAVVEIATSGPRQTRGRSRRGA